MVSKGYWGHYCVVCQALECEECDRTKMSYEPQYFTPIDEDDIVYLKEKIRLGEYDC